MLRQFHYREFFMNTGYLKEPCGSSSALSISKTLFSFIYLKKGGYTMRYVYNLLNEEPILVETVLDEHEESLDYEPSFWFWNRRYYLKDFIRAHNNPWVSVDYPENIHGYEAGNYYDPLYIELIGSAFVNVYKEAEITEKAG